MAMFSFPGAVVKVPVRLTAASLSGAINAGNKTLVGILFDSDWATATAVTFQATADPAGTYADVYDANGVEYAPVVAADTYVALSPAVTSGLVHFKVRSGTTAAPVEQTSTIWLVMREV